MSITEKSSFLNISTITTDSANAAMIYKLMEAIDKTELENKTQTVRLVSTDGNVLEFCSAIPAEKSNTPNGPEISKDEIVELLDHDTLITAVYDRVMEIHPEVTVTKVIDRDAVFLYCPRFLMLIHKYQSLELLGIAEQLATPN